jgi:hypothetical protein
VLATYQRTCFRRVCQAYRRIPLLFMIKFLKFLFQSFIKHGVCNLSVYINDFLIADSGIVNLLSVKDALTAVITSLFVQNFSK